MPRRQWVRQVVGLPGSRTQLLMLLALSGGIGFPSRTETSSATVWRSWQFSAKVGLGVCLRIEDANPALYAITQLGQGLDEIEQLSLKW